MITAIDAIPSTTTTSTAGSDTLGKNDFLLLLVAQLQAQDPLSPMDAQDFSAQLAQFSSLEQMTNVNANLEKLYAQEATMANLATLNIIGKTVDATGNSSVEVTISATTNPATPLGLSGGSGTVDLLFLIGLALLILRRAVRSA